MVKHFAVTDVALDMSLRGRVINYHEKLPCSFELQGVIAD